LYSTWLEGLFSYICEVCRFIMLKIFLTFNLDLSTQEYVKYQISHKDTSSILTINLSIPLLCNSFIITHMGQLYIYMLEQRTWKTIEIMKQTNAYAKSSITMMGSFLIIFEQHFLRVQNRRQQLALWCRHSCESWFPRICQIKVLDKRIEISHETFKFNLSS